MRSGKNRATTSTALSTHTKNTKFVHARRLAEMCCVHLQPFNIAEREGFHKYIKALDPQASFPTRKTVATTALNDVYGVYLEAVKKSLVKKSKQHNISNVHVD